MKRIVLLTTAAVALLCAVAFAQETDECRQIGARELIRALNQAAFQAASACPQAPACVCPEIPQQFVLCRQSWDGKVVRCKRFAWKAVPTVMP